MSKRRKLLFVGWDGAAWSIAEPLMRAGRMPHLAAPRRSGAAGTQHAVEPLISVPLWTSIATGQRLHVHGVAYPTEPLDDHSDVQPATARGRMATPVWDLAAAAKVRSHVINWPASAPATDTGGLFVADLFFHGRYEESVEPAEMLADLRALHVPPSAITPAMLAELGLPASVLDDPGDQRIAFCRAVLAEAASIQAITTAAMADGEWDALFVVFPGLERTAHRFMLDRLETGSEPPSAFARVVDAMYAFHDAMLGRLIELAGADANIVLLSDHGIAEDPRLHRVPATSPEAVAALRHRREGIFLAAGPDVARLHKRVHLTCFDVAPTLLALLGVPIPSDMPGQVPDGLLEDGRQPARGGSSIRRSAHLAAVPPTPVDLEHLLALGYRTPRLTNGERRAMEARRATAHLIGRDLTAAGETRAAIEVLEALVAEPPLVDAYVGALFEAYLAAGRPDDAEALLDRLPEAGRHTPLVCLGRAALAMERRSAADALEYLAQARRLGADQLPDFHTFEGEANLRLARWSEADAAFAAALAFDATRFRPLIGRCRAQLGLRAYEPALELARESVARWPHMAEAHYQLGMTLSAIGRFAEAEDALLRALELDPNDVVAHRRLLSLYEGPLDDPDRAQDVRLRLINLRMRQTWRRRMMTMV